MTTENGDYTISFPDQTSAILEGTLRLPSPSAYNDVFGAITQAIEKSSTNYTVDISNVTFLNSSGITALARLIILARGKNLPLVLRGKQSVPWQEKSISSLQKLWKSVTIELQ